VGDLESFTSNDLLIPQSKFQCVIALMIDVPRGCRILSRLGEQQPLAIMRCPKYNTYQIRCIFAVSPFKFMKE
jgi:hypothetical protein